VLLSLKEIVYIRHFKGRLLACGAGKINEQNVII
jgi:hypothetical protein